MRLAVDRPRTVHGVSLGIMMLDTGFERLPGDIGHGATWRFPVQYTKVRGVTGPMVMAASAGDSACAAALIERFAEAACELAELGVDGVSTSCGFLLAFQRELARRCPVPIATSSLLQIPSLAAILPPGQKVGILAANSAALNRTHLEEIGAPGDLPIAGLPPDSIFFQNNLSNARHVDYAQQEADLLDMAHALVQRHPEIGMLVSECTNFAPYSASLSQALNLPVFDIVSMLEWFHGGLRPRRFGP